jgi:hypothetical protein
MPHNAEQSVHHQPGVDLLNEDHSVGFEFRARNGEKFLWRVKMMDHVAANDDVRAIVLKRKVKRIHNLIDPRSLHDVCQYQSGAIQELF